MTITNVSDIAPAHRSLAQWLTHLESIHPSAIELGLNRITTVAARMDLTFADKTVIIVGGTNGKGTTCRFLEQACLMQGKTTGVYSSPHLLDYRERVRINDALPPEDEFCAAFCAIEQARAEITLTYFEFSTLAALWLMKQHDVDVPILEVGLGGRLDATNIVDADLAVITTIDLDHQDWLGDTREAIAREKAGIMREHAKAVIGELDPPVTLDEQVASLAVEARWAVRDFSMTIQDDASLWDWQCGAQRITNLPAARIPQQNVSTALAALDLLGWLPDEAQARELVATVNMPGRRQLVASEPEVIVDVGHNPQAMRAMNQWLDTRSDKSVRLVVGMLKDKSVEATLAAITHDITHWYLGATSGPRAAQACQLYESLDKSQQIKASCYNSVTEAYQAARQEAHDDELIVVFGSFLTVADVLSFHNR
ncbi:bifunctional tetrahydrofolate synthase/dihydrofolate synthase [Salinimonas lutimaris]|uniref:bifunctional tetrahydrofolate synthase/dihydrofolate synthase n=1 Tax=Salinimonas lutimaris TaxID=914153 RepID=UPI001E50FB23|nr:bifunctional tetrahydrofolate synthase/dihydrofolate synthase [Salinimonas lutimaris]